MGTEANLPLYAKNIKYLRKKSGLTQVQLGIKLKKSRLAHSTQNKALLMAFLSSVIRI